MAQAVFTWAMASNRFFARTVRIQKERAHAVASGGPYRFVRHPGYAANIVTMFAVPLLAKTTGVFHYRLGKGAR